MNAYENISQQDNAERIFHKDSSPQIEGEKVYLEDGDTCSLEEINKLFKCKYKIHDEPSVSYDYSYVLSLAKDDSFTCVAAGLSDGSVRLFNINSERGFYIEKPDKNLSICGLRFVDETSNLLLVGTTNGMVRLLDLRIKSEVCRFVNDPIDNNEPRDILCFDCNSSSRLLVMGTEQKRDNVYLAFYDFRTANKLFRYMESHQDDVTSVSFHPQNSELLCSGSTDGLINIFNVQTCDENEAILSTINTESTVEKLRWHKNHRGNYIVSCITHTNCFKAYTFDGEIIADFDRLKITETIKRKNEANCNLINCHSTADNNILLVAGTNSDRGSVLRACKFQNEQLVPYANFDGNKQRVRESIFDSKTNILITAGEGGFVTLWTPLTSESVISRPKSSSSKIKEQKSNKVKPY